MLSFSNTTARFASITRIGFLVSLLLLAALLAACTSSGSSGTPSAVASSSSPTNGSTTTASAKTGAIVEPKHVLVFGHVSATKGKKLETAISIARGVQSVSYLPGPMKLSVYLQNNITKKQRATVQSLIRKYHLRSAHSKKHQNHKQH